MVRKNFLGEGENKQIFLYGLFESGMKRIKSLRNWQLCNLYSIMKQYRFLTL